jgi:hypothetical protein
MAKINPYAHLHKIWQNECDMVPSLPPPPGILIEPIPVLDGTHLRLPTFNDVDKNYRCWWWNSFENYWELCGRVTVGTGAQGDDYIIKEDSLNYHFDAGKNLMEKGITHFMPASSPEPILIFKNPKPLVK